MRIDANSWYYSPDHGQLCQVIEIQTLWGGTTCRVWLPGSDSVVRLPAANLKPLEDAVTGTPAGITYVAATARVADALTQGTCLRAETHRQASCLRLSNRQSFLWMEEVPMASWRDQVLKEFTPQVARLTLVADPDGLLLEEAVKERFPDAIEWPLLGLPDDYRALLAPHRKAFIRDGETIVGHGGISIEELIVPLIQIERREI